MQRYRARLLPGETRGNHASQLVYAFEHGCVRLGVRYFDEGLAVTQMVCELVLMELLMLASNENRFINPWSVGEGLRSFRAHKRLGTGIAMPVPS